MLYHQETFLKKIFIDQSTLQPFITCIYNVVCIPDTDLENCDVSSLSKETLDTIEADSFWCMSKLLDGIQVRTVA